MNHTHEELNKAADELEASFQPGTGLKMLFRIAAILAAILAGLYAYSILTASIGA